MIPNKEILEKIVKHLQGILRIQDWDIKLHLCDTANMAYECEKPYVGYCTRFRESQLARIFINTDHLENKENEWYFTLAHELYHVVTDDYIFTVDALCSDSIPEDRQESVSGNVRIQYERLVNNLAKGFIKAYPVEKCFVDLGLEVQNET